MKRAGSRMDSTMARHKLSCETPVIVSERTPRPTSSVWLANLPAMPISSRIIFSTGSTGACQYVL
eukprot:6026320-Lingulodinium_polyedra.AAC.1